MNMPRSTVLEILFVMLTMFLFGVVVGRNLPTHAPSPPYMLYDRMERYR